MLDLMELRGFGADYNVYGTAVYLTTPDNFSYTVQLFQNVSDIVCAFHAFEALNSQYP